jgi:DNA-binding transcriptional LysR family regulator
MAEPMSWDSLQSFLAVVRAGRLTVAARQLGVTHSTLSRRIASLEQSLQTQLFHRRPTGYALTAQGERLVETAQAMEAMALGVAAELSGARLRVAGTVRIGAPDGFGTFFLAPVLGKLANAHPELAIQLVTMPRIASLSKREADIAISLAAPEEGRLHARRLTNYHLGLFASQAYLDEHPRIQSLSDLSGHRFIGYIEDMLYAPELDYLPLVSRDIRPSFSSSNLVVQFKAACAGHGLCVLPVFVAAEEPLLVRVLADSVSLTRAFWLIVHADMRDLARVRVAAEFITQEARNFQSRFLQ